MASLAQQYANMAGANKVYQGPTFSELLPYYQSWERLKPAAEEAGLAMINPFLQRQQAQREGQLRYSLAGTGGERFGRALGNYGTIAAEIEKQRKAQLADYLGQQEQGYRTLFYDPTREAFQRAIEQNPGETPNIPTLSTFDQLSSGQFNPVYSSPNTGFREMLSTVKNSLNKQV